VLHARRARRTALLLRRCEADAHDLRWNRAPRTQPHARARPCPCTPQRGRRRCRRRRTRVEVLAARAPDAADEPRLQRARGRGVRQVFCRF
jgi:hypothetical protein